MICGVKMKIKIPKHQHKQKEHVAQEKFEGVSTQTQTDGQFKCVECDNNSRKIEWFDTLEKEHRDLMLQYENIRTAYYDQADEKQILREKIVELEECKINQSKEILKIKRDSSKQEKTLAAKIVELEAKVTEC